ncbi:MAG: PQQ-binding-like beta-propeller repeat protein [Planctomycetes bacterium]|nr:PQQ-binding-like beta-propeller repeat protein [Planctomycetota bacterium]
MSSTPTDPSSSQLPDETNAAEPIPTPVPQRGFAWLRLILALSITYGVLIYAWGRSFLEGVMIYRGGTGRRYLFQLGVGMLAVMLCTAGLSRRFQSARIDRWVLRGATGIWFGVVLVTAWFVIGDLLPKLFVVPFFALASSWVLCGSWLWYRRWPWRARLAGVLAGILVQVAFVVLFRVEGIQGQFKVDFNWRSAPVVDHGSELPSELVPTQAEENSTEWNAAGADDFPQFLGPDRTAVLHGRNLASDWTTTPPREVWRTPVGAGWSGFACVGQYAITQEQRGANECIVCYRLDDGSPVWVHADEARFESDMGGIGPRATPTIVDGRVYAVGGTGILNCLEGATGESLWHVNILEDNHGGKIAHGVCGSPLVVGDLVIVAPTGVDGTTLAAYDRQTGARKWQGGPSRASYGSPALATLAGREQVLLVNHDGIAGNDLRTGAPLWDFPWTGDLHVNCSQPVIVDAERGRVFYGTGYGQGSVLLEIGCTKPDEFQAREIWRSPGKLKTKFTTAVRLNDYVYGLDDGILACLDLRDGKQQWKGGRYGHGQILLAGELLIVQTEPGDVVLVQPDPQKLIERGRIAALTAKTWNNPALAGRRLIVRNDREAVCYELPVRTNDRTSD